MPGVLSFLFSKWGVAVAVALVIGALSLSNRQLRIEIGGLRIQVQTAKDHLAAWEQAARDQEAARAAALADLKSKQEKTVADLRAQHAAQLAVLAQRYQGQITKLKEQLDGYVSPAADARCVLPVGAILLHDSAARGVANQGGAELAGATSGSLDAPSGIRLSTLVGTVAENYLAGRQSFDTCAAEVSAWRDWYVAQRDLFLNH